jgi:predicted HAD superfamily Cof-like phosphohydrolase
MENKPHTQIRTKQDMVREFMLGFGQEVNDRPKMPGIKQQGFRLSLNLEELFEIMAATDLVERVDGLCDLLYTTYGWAETVGVRLTKVSENEADTLPSDVDDEKHFKWLAQCCMGAAVSFTVDGIAYWLSEIIDAVYSWGEKMGVDATKLDACFEEVHRSNMSKFWTPDEIASAPADWTRELTYGDGYVVKDANGKVRKSPSWKKPNLEEVLK